MPDVTLLEQDVAMAVLADHGVAADAVTLAEEPWAGGSGRVLRTDPSPGASLGGPVLLVLSSSAKVPDVRGLARSEAVAAVENLGAVARVRPEYQPGADAGVALDSDPPPGQPLPDVVEIAVADVGEAVDLTTLSSVESDRVSRDSQLSGNGTLFATLLEFQPDSPSRDDPLEPAYVSYNLGRQADRLEGTVALDDNGRTQGRLELRVIGDGKQLDAVTVAFGESATLSVDVRGVLRLRLAVMPTGRDEDQPVLLLGEPNLVGSAEAVAALVSAS